MILPDSKVALVPGSISIEFPYFANAERNPPFF